LKHKPLAAFVAADAPSARLSVLGSKLLSPLTGDIIRISQGAILEYN